MKKAVAIILVISLISVLVLSFAACDKQDGTGTETEPEVVLKNAVSISEEHETYQEISITDFTYPQGFDVGLARLEVYNGEENRWEAADENSAFDPNKPTIFFAHGIGTDLHGRNPHAMYAKGYNVISFLWGVFSDNNVSLQNVEVLIWDRITMYYDKEKSTVVMSDGFDCTVAEIYLARYCDFFKQYPGYNQPIIMTGHSYGGQLTCAMSGIMTKYRNEGKMNPAIFPIKYMLIDP